MTPEVLGSALLLGLVFSAIPGVLATLRVRTWNTPPDTQETPADPSQSWETIGSLVVVELV